MTMARKDHACPANDCGVTLPRHTLMCRPHWRMVPKVMQRQVKVTWRTAVRLSKQPLADSGRVQAVRDYLATRRAAVDFVNGRLAHD